MTNLLNRIAGTRLAAIALLCGTAVFSIALQNFDQAASFATASVAPVCTKDHSDDFSGPYDADRMGEIANDVGASEYYVMPDHGGLSIESGWLAVLSDDFGTAVGEATSLAPNLYWNLSDATVFIRFADKGFLPLEPNGMMLICSGDNTMGDLHESFDAPPGPGTSLNITCKPGYYACCKIGPPPSARCVLDAIISTCDAGGPGTASCAVAVP